MPGLLKTSSAVEYGRRLIPNIIDDRAQREPNKAFASIPRSKDPADGFIDVSYSVTANAVNRASWWLSQSMGNADTPEVFAYLGPNDPRYPILLTAAMKCGYQMMLPSPRNSVEYQQELLRRAGCKTVFCARNLMAKMALILDGTDLDICYIVAPELAELLDPEPETPFPYEVAFDEVKKDAFLILHTSGSTGPPKPITFTIECTTTEDTHRLLEDPSGRLWWRLFANRRYFLGMPCYHSAGIWFALFMPVYFDSTVVYGPGDRPLTGATVDAVNRATRISGGIYPPSVLEEMCRTEALDGLRKLDFVAYGGGPLSKSAGDTLSRSTILHNFIGFTEASAPPRYVMEPEDWSYFQFHPAAGYTPEHLHGDFYKMVFKRLPDYEFSQTAFRLFPDLDEYSSGDILSPHPSKPNLWTYRGRVDDLIVLSSGEKFNPIPTEMLLKSCPVVKDALMIGDGRAQAALLVECDSVTTTGMPLTNILEELWPFVQTANTSLPTQGRLIKQNILFAPADKHFSRSPKGSVQRKATVANFETELNHLYAGQTAVLNGISHRKPIKLNLVVEKSQEPIVNSIRSPLTITPVSPRTLTQEPAELERDNDSVMSTTSVSQEDDLFEDSRVSPTDAIDFIRNALWTLCGIHNVSEDADLFELGLDSILALQISNELQNYSVSWPQDQASAMQLFYSRSTIRGLADAISNPGGYHGVLTTPPSTFSEVVMAPLDKAITHPAKSEAAETQETKTQGPSTIEQLIQKFTKNLAESVPPRSITVALTGSTGSIGSHILDHLIRQPNVAKVICLNRSEGGEKAQEAANVRNRMTLTSGSKPVNYFQTDLSQPFLGLQPGQYATIQREADIIIHCSWKLDFLQTVKSFEQTHIAGIRHLVDLAASSERRPRIVFLSSIATVFSWKEDQSVPEEIFLSTDITGNNGYAHSKYVAERILHEASKTAGVHATIVRLGQISGPTETGVGIWNQSDWVPQIVSTCKSLGAVPKSLGMADVVDWMPIDRLPRILMDLIQHDLDSSERLQVYHARNPTPVSWGSLLPAVCHRLGSDVKLVSYQQWLAMLQAKAEQGADVKTFPALRLLGWLQQLDAPMGMSLPTLAVEKMVNTSLAFSELMPICGAWMENWMSAWGL